MRTPRSVIRFAASGLLAAAFATTMPAAAQDASPAAGGNDTVCAIEPRDAEELIGFYFDPEGARLATPIAPTVDAEAELPPGEPADPAIVEAVNATFAELAACFEAEQYARAFALMTDDLARQTGPDPNNPDEDSPEEVRALLEAQLAGTPVADDPAMEEEAPMDVGQGRDIRALEGGRVGGVWEFDGDAAFVVFEEEDGRWLIDELIDIVEDDAAMSGTPAP